MTGHLPCHEALERELAAFKGYPAALAFSSGFAANLGILPALVGRGDYVCADRLIHASLIDGLRLSGARCVRFPHNDAGRAADLLARAPAGARKLVVTESVFSMDGDRAPLKALAEIAANAGASLYVDEAHATGTIGPGGRGGIAEAGLGPDTVAFAMGTLSKALGSAGGYLACAPVIRDGLVQSSRSMIYSTGLPPPVAGAVLGALKVLRAKPERAAELQARAERFRARLKEAGLNTGASSTHIVPVIAGGTGRAISLATRLRAEGILAVPIRPPTVPAGTARIRFSISWGHTAEELDYTADTVIRAAREEGWW
jgi:8-amino-7-oxononanoate synthase